MIYKNNIDVFKEGVKIYHDHYMHGTILRPLRGAPGRYLQAYRKALDFLKEEDYVLELSFERFDDRTMSLFTNQVISGVNV